MERPPPREARQHPAVQIDLQARRWHLAEHLGQPPIDSITIDSVTIGGGAERSCAGTLKLVAQGGQRPSMDLPVDAQWDSFQSLGILKGRGPIFTATLVVGKGGVTAASSKGVWALDFTGVPRLLFRTGVPNAVVNGKTLKSFILLDAIKAEMGVTRSFNDAAHVTWQATFTDNTQAIIRTTVP